MSFQAHEGIEFVLVSKIAEKLKCDHEGIEFVSVSLEDKIKTLDSDFFVKKVEENKHYIISKYNRSKRIKIN